MFNEDMQSILRYRIEALTDDIAELVHKRKELVEKLNKLKEQQ